MAGGQGGRPPGRRDNPYAPRKRRPPTDEEKKRKDEKSAATRARTRERKDAAKLAQAAEAAAQRANKRANFFNPRGTNSRQSTKSRSSPNAQPSDARTVSSTGSLRLRIKVSFMVDTLLRSHSHIPSIRQHTTLFALHWRLHWGCAISSLSGSSGGVGGERSGRRRGR